MIRFKALFSNASITFTPQSAQSWWDQLVTLNMDADFPIADQNFPTDIALYLSEKNRLYDINQTDKNKTRDQFYENILALLKKVKFNESDSNDSDSNDDRNVKKRFYSELVSFFEKLSNVLAYGASDIQISSAFFKILYVEVLN